MVKNGRIYIIIAVFTLGVILLLEYNKPKEVNWYPSYVSQHKIPYGTKVYNTLLQKFFPDQTEQVYKPPFEFLKQNDTVSGTYFFVNGSIEFAEAELDALLNWVFQGNNLFIASEGFEEQLLDTLNLAQKSYYNNSELNPVFNHELVNPNLISAQAAFEKDYYTLIFNEIDTLNTVILGQVHVSDSVESKKVNVISQPFGKGSITLSTFPKAFTNYFILKEGHRAYTAGLISYLNNGDKIYVDNYYRAGKTFYTSPMYIFLNTKEFKWAYYIVLIGLLFYVIFEGKRKQRPIPIVVPLKNQTLQFTRTIADMYFEQGQQKEVVTHKISYFLEYIRSKFHLNTSKPDERFLKSLAARSNHTVNEVGYLFELMDRLSKKSTISNIELKQFNKKIENFKAKADGKQ